MIRVHRPGGRRNPPPIETLERRELLSAAHSDPFPAPGTGPEFVYVDSNNPEPGRNAVLAFRRNPSTGSLRQIGTFLTGGTGFGNATQGLGPDDSDQEVVASPDGRFLFAVNQGSNSIAVFGIQPNGVLRTIGTYDSGGTQPVSLALSGDHLFVVNRGDALQGRDATIAGNYTAFRVAPNGALAPVPGSTITLPLGVSPAQALVSRDGRFVFGDNFAIPGTTPDLAQTIDPFRIQPDGTLARAPGGPVAAAVNPNVLLGTAVHPTLPVIYGGLVGANGIAVFTHDAQGSVTFADAVPDQGAAPCWAVVSADGKFLYASNTGPDSVGVFSLADPLHPVQLQEFALSGPFAPAGATDRQTASFQIALDPSGKSLYVITQDTASGRDFQEGNAIHALTVAPDGTLSESNAPVTFPASEVPAAARIQGVAVVALHSRHGRAEGAPVRGDAGGGRPVVGIAPRRSPFGSTLIDGSETDSASVRSSLLGESGGRKRIR
jgi:6-phosphogluconolactonase (cycloisomerase 2 family)